MKHINPGEQFRIPMDAVEDDVEKSGNKRLKTIWEKIQQEQDVDAMEYMSLAYIYGNSGLPASLEKGDWISAFGSTGRLHDGTALHGGLLRLWDWRDAKHWAGMQILPFVDTGQR